MLGSSVALFFAIFVLIGAMGGLAFILGSRL